MHIALHRHRRDHRAGGNAGNRPEAHAIFQQQVQRAPGEGAMRAAALQGEDRTAASRW
jgi:hypothetical protein